MDDTQCYELKLPIIEAIKNKDTKIPKHIPVNVYLEESDALYHWCAEDKAALRARNFDWTLVEDLPIRAGALRKAQAIWYMAKKGTTEVTEEWRKEYPAALKFKRELSAHYLYAFRDHPNLTKTVRALSKNETMAYLPIALGALEKMGREEPELLEAINFDMSLLDKIDTISVRFSRLFAGSTNARWNRREIRGVRDKAYTHLKEAVDEIKRAGKFVFRDNPQRLEGYGSEHLRKKNQQLTAQRNARNETNEQKE